MYVCVHVYYIYIIHTAYTYPLVFKLNHGSHGPSIDDWNDVLPPETGASP